MPMHKAKYLVILAGRGKRAWFSEIEAGHVPDTTSHAFARHTDEAAEIRCIEAFPMTFEKLKEMLWADTIVASDISRSLCILGFLRSVTAGMFGPRTFLICINTSSVIRKNEGKMRLRFLQMCWRSYSGLVCLARFQMEDLERMGVASHRLAFIPLGIDTTFMRAAGAPQKGDYILSVGHDAGRDYQYLLRIAHLVPYPIRIIAREKNIPRDTVLPANVQVEYDIPITEVRARILRARFVVVPTKEDAVGASDCSGQTVVLQALAAGVPVCASIRPWVRDYLKEGEDFCALPDSNEQAAADVLNELWGDESKRDALAACGQRTVEERFTTSAFAQSLRRFIHERTEGKKSPAKK